jgi:hypothetical protein
MTDEPSPSPEEEDHVGQTLRACDGLWDSGWDEASPQPHCLSCRRKVFYLFAARVVFVLTSLSEEEFLELERQILERWKMEHQARGEIEHLTGT